MKVTVTYAAEWAELTEDGHMFISIGSFAGMVRLSEAAQHRKRGVRSEATEAEPDDLWKARVSLLQAQYGQGERALTRAFSNRDEAIAWVEAELTDAIERNARRAEPKHDGFPV